MLVNYAHPPQKDKLSFNDFTKEYFEKLAPEGFTFVRIEESWRRYQTQEGEQAFQVTPVGLFRGETVTIPDAGYYDSPAKTRMAYVKIDGSVTFQDWYDPSLSSVNAILSAD